MTKIIKDKGIVLRKRKYRETSKLVTIFSEASGKLNLVAKGVRSQKSKNSAVLEPINLIEFVYYFKHTRELQYISSVEFLNDYSKIKSDFEKLKYAFVVLDIVNLFSKEGEPNQILFDLTINFLDLINESDIMASALFDYFIIKTSEISGYPVVTSVCPICHKDLNLIAAEFVFTKDFGTVCSACSFNKNNVIDLTEEEKILLVGLYFEKLNEFGSAKFRFTTNKLLNGLIDFMKYHVDEFKYLKSFQILET